MKKLLIKLFFREKFVGQLSAGIAGVLAGWLLSSLPSAPAAVLTAVDVVINFVNAAADIDLPKLAELSQGELAVYLALGVTWGINALVQQFVAKDNNQLLAELQQAGKYSGPLDSWVGPVALSKVTEVINENIDAGLGR